MTKPIPQLSALELQALINASVGDLHTALKEVARLRGVAIDIIDLINTSSKSAIVFGDLSDLDHTKLLMEINNIAGKYYQK